AVGLTAVAIAAQIGGDDVESLRELRRNLVPKHMRLRVAVHQQDGRTATAGYGVDGCARGLNIQRLETRKQRIRGCLGRCRNMGGRYRSRRCRSLKEIAPCDHGMLLLETRSGRNRILP